MRKCEKIAFMCVPEKTRHLAIKSFLAEEIKNKKKVSK